MIASVTGTVASASLESAVVLVGGVGLAVQATPATLARLRVGEPVQLATSLVVREDALTLFGFTGDDERDVFELLQTIQGVGPRLALATLAVLTPDQLRRAVADQDHATLTRVPGIGRKGAQRLVLELAGRLGEPASAEMPGGPEPVHAPSIAPQVVDALAGLGWNRRLAEDAVREATETGGPVGDSAGLLRAALVVLGGSAVGGAVRG
mgnify:CR=1 FL=1